MQYFQFQQFNDECKVIVVYLTSLCVNWAFFGTRKRGRAF
jgi:hypothetical protein